VKKVAVIGAGYWGPNLIRNFRSHGVVGVVACDVNPTRLAQVAKQSPGLECVSNYEEMLKLADVDAVAIATPVRFHYPMAKAALQAGKHVLLEKPMAISSAQARELIELAETKKLVLMVDHTFIYTGAVEKITQICRSSNFGDFYYIDSVRINLGLFQHDVNVIWDLATHDLSIVNHVLQRKPKVVRAIGQSHVESGLVDVAYVNVEYGYHITANFHINWLSPTKIRQMIFAGSNRMIVWNDLDPAEKIRVYDKGVNIKRTDVEERYAIQVGYRTGDAWLPNYDNTEALEKMTAHFLECIEQSKKPLTGGPEGLDVVMALEASELSLANGGRPVGIDGERIALV
jgi:predicted dehydrogenase